MFRHAASYFGDPDAQYHLGRLYLHGTGTAKDGVQAARWLRLAANKGQRSAQALLGEHAVQGPGRGAAGRDGLVLADGRQGCVAGARPTRRGSPRPIAARSRRRPRTSARWRYRLSRRAGMRTRAALSATQPSRLPQLLTTLDRQIDHHRNVVRRLFPGPHMAVDRRRRPAGRRPAATAARGRCGCRCSSARRRPDSPRTCRGRRCRCRRAPRRSGRDWHSARKRSRVCGRNSASPSQAAGLRASAAVGMTL